MFLQHIAAASDWERALKTGHYDRSTRGASIVDVGFLHASDGPAQTAAVLSAVYSDESGPLVLLTLDPGELHRSGLRIVLEPGDPTDPDGEWFPHVYGGPIPVAAVLAAVPVDRGASLHQDAPTDQDASADHATDEAHLTRAIDLATASASTDGGPFGALVVTVDGHAFQGTNRVTATHDPTAHAEVTALRAASAGLGTFDLTGAVLYSSCEPCPMCLGAALWSRVSRVLFAADRGDAAVAGFDDAAFYDYFDYPDRRDMMPVVRLVADRSTEPFTTWQANLGRTTY